MRRRLLALLLLALLSCVACNSKSVIPTISPPSPLASPLLTTTSWPTITPTLTPPPTPTPWPTPTATTLSTPAPTPAGIAPPPGLIYKTNEGLWRIEVNGQPTKLIDQVYDAAISPDGNRLFTVSNDLTAQTLWLIDLKTGERRNLTENLDRVVCCPVWWPSQQDWVIFQSWKPDDLAPDNGYLSAARIDGQEQRVLDSEYRSNGLPAPAPEGQTIAYDRSGEAWLYDLNTGPRPFDPQTYGVRGIQRIGSPAWSPDGKQLAWYIGGDFGQGWQVGIAVFDLETKQGRLLHVYNNLGRGGWFTAPTWSPDGQWLAFSAEDQDQAKAGLWIIRGNGQEERLIAYGENRLYTLPVWSPDGRELAAGRTLYEVGTWRAHPLALPPDAEVVAWINPASQ
jgi:Tol biopolymer transport system component